MPLVSLGQNLPDLEFIFVKLCANLGAVDGFSLSLLAESPFLLLPSFTL
jgi:hypothetical protein